MSAKTSITLDLNKFKNFEAMGYIEYLCNKENYLIDKLEKSFIVSNPKNSKSFKQPMTGVLINTVKKMITIGEF
jgi:hypothetical protein